MAVEVDEIRTLRDAAAEIVKKDHTRLILKSCWDCDEEHEAMRAASFDVVIYCMGCGRYFYRSNDITPVR